MPKPLLIVLPSRDFDPTEAAVPWQKAQESGLSVVFATEDGLPAACDPLVIAGPLFGLLGATPDNCKLYETMTETAEFQQPRAWPDLRSEDFSALVLPGGHAKGMRQYLESTSLRELVLAFFVANQPVGSICHGGVVLARTRYENGASVIAGRRVTALTRSLENTAWLLTAWKLGDYYRTYPTWVEAELREAQAAGDQGAGAQASSSEFLRGPLLATYNNPFVVRDGNLLTARWPGDASRFGEEIVAMALASD